MNLNYSRSATLRPESSRYASKIWARALLAAASSAAELCRSVRPDFSHWLWNYRPKARAAAQDLFQR